MICSPIIMENYNYVLCEHWVIYYTTTRNKCGNFRSVFGMNEHRHFIKREFSVVVGRQIKLYPSLMKRPYQ